MRSTNLYIRNCFSLVSIKLGTNESLVNVFLEFFPPRLSKINFGFRIVEKFEVGASFWECSRHVKHALPSICEGPSMNIQWSLVDLRVLESTYMHLGNIHSSCLTNFGNIWIVVFIQWAYKFESSECFWLLK